MRALCLLPVALLGLAGAASAENKFAPNNDPMTDAVGGDAILNTDGTIMTGVSCVPDAKSHVDVQFASRESLGYTFNQAGSAKVRIDGGAPFVLVGGYGGNGFMIETHAKPNSPGGHFIEQIRIAKHVVVQLTKIDGETLTDEFDLGDAREKIDQAVALCHDPQWAKAINTQ